MSENGCPFCRSLMEITSTSSHMHVDTWRCRTCGAQRSYGWEKLPDPDKLRKRSEKLERLADEVENSELASRMEVAHV